MTPASLRHPEVVATKRMAALAVSLFRNRVLLAEFAVALQAAKAVALAAPAVHRVEQHILWRVLVTMRAVSGVPLRDNLWRLLQMPARTERFEVRGVNTRRVLALVVDMPAIRDFADRQAVRENMGKGWSPLNFAGT